MKKLHLILLSLLSFALISGCSADNQQSKNLSSNDDSINIVTTIFPTYDWTRQILGDNLKNVELNLLTDNGADLHNYQPSTDDMVQIADCDLLIYVGGISDSWIDDAISSYPNDNRTVINLMDVLGDSVKEEEYIEGMEHDHDHENESIAHEDDEHVWLSLKNAKTLCNSISSALCSIDSANSEMYKLNTENYIAELDKLDAEYAQTVQNSDVKTLIFADRFPFRYLVDDYSLNYYAAFSGCSSETEASFETVIFLANKLDELGINSVLTIDGGNSVIAKTVIDNTKNHSQNMLMLDSMQSVSAEEIENGMTYLSVMQDNLSTISSALDVKAGV